MKKLVILFACLTLSGCIKTVSRQDLDNSINAHAHETVSSVWYAGSQDGYHSLHHGHTLGSDAFRIQESQFQIADPFPLTKDETKWRILKKNWDIWWSPDMLNKMIKRNSQQIGAR